MTFSLTCVLVKGSGPSFLKGCGQILEQRGYRPLRGNRENDGLSGVRRKEEEKG